MTTRYYTISYSEAIKAWNAYELACHALEKACQAVAKKYEGSKPVYASSVHGLAFHGLKFEPALDSPLWTIAMEKEGYVQRPRSALPKNFKGDRKESNRLRNALETTWRADMATIPGRVNQEPFWEAIGTNWGNLFFASIEWFRFQNVIYVATSATLDPRAVEITGSEYDAAKKGAS